MGTSLLEEEMRRLVLSVLGAAVALLAASFAAIPSTAGAAGLVDLSASTASNPAAVSPPGALVIYTATFRNEGAVSVAGLFTNATSNGKLVQANVSLPGACVLPAAGTADPSISCSASLAAGQALTLEVVVQSPLTAPSAVANSSSARVDPSVVQVLDLFPANDNASVTTPVRATTGVGAAGFVREGGTLSYKKHVLTVRDADLGVVAFLNDVPAVQSADCGGTPCQEGLRADFDQDPRFFGLVAVDVNFGPGDPCRGIGADQCHPLFFRKGAIQPTAPILPCGSQAPNDPCQESVAKVGTEFHFVVVMQTDDPDLLSPVKSALSGSVQG
jgi:hypothetical protein